MAARLTRGQSNIRWIETYCRIPDGKFVGQPVRLRRWQRREIRKIYDNPARTRTAILSLGRKNAKTTLAAFLLLLHLCGPEAVPSGQLYSTALSRDQAAILFDLAAKIVQMSPDINSIVGIRDTAKHLYCHYLGTIYKALSADASLNYGKSPVFSVHDELGQVRGPRSQLYEAIETASGAHDHPLSIIISTQAPTDADLLSILIDDALAGHDRKVTVSLYTAPVDLNPFLVSTIKRANPAYGDFLSADEVKRSASEAKRMPSRELAFRNLILNQRVNQESPLIAPMLWKANGRKPRDSAFENGVVQIGLDLSARNDLTALVYTADEDGYTHVRCEFFAPKVGVEHRSLRDRTPYDMWARSGLLMLTPGASVKYDYVAARLIELCDRMNVAAVYFDRWRIDVLAQSIDHMHMDEDFMRTINGGIRDIPLIPHGQGFKDMGPAVDELESRLLDKRLRHGNNPILTMCAANTIADKDPAGNRKFNKAKSTSRIDGLVALAMCMQTKMDQKEEHVSGHIVAI